MAPVLTKSGAPSNRREKIPEGTLCVVCGDLASGIHYSVASCNGCKTFFRRALVNKQTFTCQFNGECLVGKSVRCVCRSCRLKKCFETGMDPKAIQHDRDKIRYTKVLKRQREEMQAREAEEREKLMKMKEEMGSPNGMTTDCCNTPSSSRMPSSEYDMNPGPDVVGELEGTLSTLMRIEKRVVAVRNAYRFDNHVCPMWNMYIGTRAYLDDDQWVKEHSVELPQTQQSTKISPWALREWFQRDLTLMMEWVKCLPEAKLMLLNDKCALLKAYAISYPVLQLAYYTRDQTVLSAPDTSQSGVSPPKKTATPPPPTPTTSTPLVISAGLMTLVQCIEQQQNMLKRSRIDGQTDEQPCSSSSLGLDIASVLRSNPFLFGLPHTMTAVSTAPSTIIQTTPLLTTEPQARMIERTESQTLIDVETVEEEKKKEEQTVVDVKMKEEDEETPNDPTPVPQLLNRLNYPDGTYVERDPDNDRPDELYMLLIDGVWRVFRMNNVDQETFALYKMLLFFNTDFLNENASQCEERMTETGVNFVKEMRNKMYKMLYIHLFRTRGRDGIRVFGNLMIMSSTIARIRHSLRKLFSMSSIFVPSNDLVDQFILRDTDERPVSPSAFRPYIPPVY